MNSVKLTAVVCLCVLSVPAFAGTVPRSKHIWIITEENRSYESVIGSSYMPYYNSLAKKSCITACIYFRLRARRFDLYLSFYIYSCPKNWNTTCRYLQDILEAHSLFQ